MNKNNSKEEEELTWYHVKGPFQLSKGGRQAVQISVIQNSPKESIFHNLSG